MYVCSYVVVFLFSLVCSLCISLVNSLFLYVGLSVVIRVVRVLCMCSVFYVLCYACMYVYMSVCVAFR